MGTPGTPSAEQNSTSWVSHSDNVLDFVGRFLSVKKHQQDQAKSELQGAMSLSQAGFPVDPKVFSKLVKKSGLPIATDEKTLQAFHSSAIEEKEKGKQGQGQPQGQGQQGQAGGPPSVQAPDGSPQYVKEVAEAHNKIAQTGKPLEAGEEMGLYMNVLAGRARQLMNTKATSDQQKAENELHVEDLKAKGLSGDNEARGTLMRMGEVKVDTDFEKWTAMSKDQQKGMFDIMAGNESRSELAQRSTRISESLMTSGRFRDPESAFRAGKILAEGGSLPADLAKKMKPYGFDDLAQQTVIGGRLLEMGVPPDKLGQTMRAAAAGGLENALPQGMKPLAIRAMEIDAEKLQLEELRYGKELEIAKRAAAAESRKGITDEQKAQLEEFKSLVELKKSGGSIPDEIIKGAQGKAAKALGMEPSEVKTLFNFFTGGTKTEYKPRVTDEGKSQIDKLVGKQAQDEDQPTEGSKGFKGFVQGLTKKKDKKSGI